MADAKQVLACSCVLYPKERNYRLLLVNYFCPVHWLAKNWIGHG